MEAQNAIYLDAETGGKGRQFKARFLVPGLVKYDYGVCLLTKENADKFIQGFVGCPVIINHHDVTDKNVKELGVGNIFSVWFDEKDGYYWCNGIINDKKAIELIDKGYSVSCQYTITEYSDNNSGALHNGNPYDKIIENGKPEHLAIVDNPRYEGAIIAVNAVLEETKEDLQAENAQESFEEQFKDTLYTALAEGIANRLGELIASNEDKWITIHPHGEESEDYRRLLIKDGETVEDAMHRQGYYDKRKAKFEKNKKELEEKIKELLEKARRFGGEKTVLGQKYIKQAEELKKDEKGEKEGKTNSLLPSYANDFFKKKEEYENARQKYHELLAEYQTKAKTDKKFKEYQEKLDEVYAQMSKIGRYNEDFQKLVNEKNKIIDEKHAYEKEFFKEVYAAQDKASSLNTNIDKKEIIKKMSNAIKTQISKISSKNNDFINKLNKIDMSEKDILKKQDEEYNAKQDELIEQMRELSYDDPKRAAMRAQYADYAAKRGEIVKKQKEFQYKTAIEVGKLLQVKNGIKLNTKNSPAMQEITNKLKECLDGVIPSTNFNNAEMTVRKHEGRAFHSGSTINISAKDKIETAIHETMHHLEEHSEHVLMNSLAFAASRTEGEKQASLKRLTGLRYKANEVCKKDSFFNPYCGKLYDVFGGREKTFANATASEIMSMGVQELFTNPKEFAKNDREYFDFVVANLRGEVWS